MLSELSINKLVSEKGHDIGMYAEIIINSDALEVDRLFTYKVPEEFLYTISAGHRVIVSFGKGNKKVEGFVYTLIVDDIEINYRVKNILKICDEEPILTIDNLKLVDFLRRRYLCRYIDAIRLMIPVGIMKGSTNKKKAVICINDELKITEELKENYKKLYNYILENDGIYTKADITRDKQYSLYTLNKMISDGIFKVEDKVIFRYNKRKYDEDVKKELTQEQEQCLDTILNGSELKYLIKGVTGSGKTEVYMNLVSETLNEGKSAVVLVPEISLTPQMIERFKGRFGGDVALFHSRLSDGERFDEWYRIRDGKARLVIGARSALFLPLDNLGLIIIDEEHENTYKSDQNPKYHTREVSEYMCKLKRCKLVLGSATPSIETYYKALSGEYKLIEMKSRVNGRAMPHMEIVDMREELKRRNLSLFSGKLYKAIDETLNRKKQIILFLNRRGYSTFISCRSCGYVFKCPECDVSMTYHNNGYLICHYCGRAEKVSKICPECGSRYVKFFGAGTERVELEVKKYFPKARVLRMDVDTTRHKNSHESIYNSFKNGEADILVGTQMVSKGLDFKNVTLVGVLAADMSINIPDYRAAERTFQIITQVAGRAGRGDKQGTVVIQTYTPEHYSLEYAVNYDYEGFYEKEFTVRALMKYPPFGKILLINGVSKKEDLLKNFMHKISNVIKPLVESEVDVDILGPIPCLVAKVKENYRWQIVIKGEFQSEFAKKIKELLYDENKNVYNDIRISMDINPNNLF